MDIKYKLIKNFGPSIFAAKIPDDVMTKLNKYVDQTIENQKKSKELDYGENLVGDVTQEIKIDKNTIQDSGWLNFLGTCTKKWIELETNKKITKFNLKQTWVVRQFKNEYNPIHFHSGNISAVGYLKIPKNITKSKKRLKTNGTIDFIHGSKSFLSNSLFNHNPKVGDMIIFPNYLMHTAYPFKREGERRSFSFNLDIDKKTFDVFHG